MVMAIPGIAAVVALVQVIPLIETVGRPITRQVEYGIESIFKNKILTEEQLLDLRVRQIIDDDDYRMRMGEHGINSDYADMMVHSVQAKLEAAFITDMYRRKLIDERKYRELLHLQGFNDAYQDLLIAGMAFYPSPSDLISWEVKSVFRPDIVETFQLEDEKNLIQREPFYKAGINDEQIDNFWKAHWNPPPVTAIREFVHWGLLEADLGSDEHPTPLRQWFKEAAVPPYWREKYLATIYEPLTRVDIRRMWDLGVLNDDEVKEAYRKIGYSPHNAEELLKFTKLLQLTPELRKRFSKGWLTVDQLRAELKAIELSDAKVERVIQTLVKNDKAERTATEKDLTKAELIKGLKQGKLTVEQTHKQLQQLGYDSDEASFIISINYAQAKEMETPLHHEVLVRQYLASQGVQVETIPQAAIDIDNEFHALVTEYHHAISTNESEAVINDLAVKVDAERYRYRAVMASYHLEQFATI